MDHSLVLHLVCVSLAGKISRLSLTSYFGHFYVVLLTRLIIHFIGEIEYMITKELEIARRGYVTNKATPSLIFFTNRSFLVYITSVSILVPSRRNT